MTGARAEQQVRRISVRGRQCVAVTCLERFCDKYGLRHPDITAFIEHVWKVAQIHDETFGEWEAVFGELAITGQGDPYPDGLAASIPARLARDFDELTQRVYESSAATWYSVAELSIEECLAALRIAEAHQLPLPDVSRFINEPVDLFAGWGPPVTDETLAQWRGSAVPGSSPYR